MEYAKAIVVDDNDVVIGAEYVPDAKEKGLIMRGSRVMVRNDRGEFLLQIRGENITYPLKYDTSVGGHVDEGESYLDAAQREMREEIGVTGFELVPVVVTHRDRNYFCTIYTVTVPSDLALRPDAEEVADLVWMSPADIDMLLQDRTEECAPGLVDVWQNLRDKLIQS